MINSRSACTSYRRIARIALIHLLDLIQGMVSGDRQRDNVMLPFIRRERFDAGFNSDY
jgi:hypothetical protein